MTLSTPPNSDGVLTSCQVEPAASTVTNDRRITSESSSSKSNKINLTAKSPCVALKRLTDKELKNEFVFNEIRDKLTKMWPSAKNEILPGIPNIDLISSDENLLSLVRDGLRYRDKPTTKSAGASMAALTNRKGSSSQRGGNEGDLNKLREQAKAGDKKAGDNLLVAQLQRLRQQRGGR